MILGVLQARMSSRRLPGKVVAPILDRPMILRQLERLERSRAMTRLVVATSADPSDDPLAGVLDAAGYGLFRGSLDDVLDRMYRASLPYRPQHVVRLTADCPVADWRCIDELIAFHLAGRYDYSTNTLEPTLPDGMDAEVMTTATFEAAWQRAKTAREREHVTPYIYESGNFSIGIWKNIENLSDYRLTVDQQEDLDLIRNIYNDLYRYNSDFSLDDILDWLRAHPDHAKSNMHFQRNEALKTK